MAWICIEKIADKLYREARQERQNVKFNFVKAEIRFLNINSGVQLSYTTGMHERYGHSVSVMEWSKNDWYVFVRDAIAYYRKHSRYVLDRFISFTFFTADNLSICFLV